MDINAKFIKYIENELPPEQSYGLMGIAVVSRFNGAEIAHYTVKQNKNGGYFIESMAQKMNGIYFKASTIDSNYADQEIKDMIRKHVNAYYSKTPPMQNAVGDSQKMPGVPAFTVEEEVPF